MTDTDLPPELTDEALDAIVQEEVGYAADEDDAATAVFDRIAAMFHPPVDACVVRNLLSFTVLPRIRRAFELKPR